MTTKPVIAQSTEGTLSRRGFFMKLGILFNGFAAMVLAVAMPRSLWQCAETMMRGSRMKRPSPSNSWKPYSS